jgi:hypothetical protein
MGIQINGSTDIISAVDGSLTVENLSINTSGVGTFGSLDISGNVSVGGTLTYEDVANVESVGVATFRDDVNIGVGGTTAFFDVSTGRFGINETSPQQKLHVGGDVEIGFASPTDAARQIIFDANRGSTGATIANINWQWNSTNVAQIRGITGEDTSNKDDAHLAFFTAPSGSLAERLRITSAGNVGIGLTNPDWHIDIKSTSANAVVRLKSSGSTNGGQLQVNSDDLLLRNRDSAGDLQFWTNDTKRVTITSTGDVVLAAGQTVGSSAGVVTYFGDGSQLSGISVGLTTEATTPSNAVTELDLTAAQDHKVTATGICTITVTGGTEADSHTVRIVNSGIATVGFSTYFLFPSGSAPTLPTASGAISLISFTVHRVGAAGTQLLAGASVNFS